MMIPNLLHWPRLPHILLSTSLLLAVALHSTSALANNTVRVDVDQAREVELVNEVPVSGSVSASQIAQLSSQVAGLVQRIHVEAGDQVSGGELLVELDSELAAIALDSARASANSAREARADSQRRFEEAQTLVARNAIAASEVRGLESAMKINAAAVQVAEAQVRQREAELQRHRIEVPFDGTLSRKLVEVGEWVTPGTALLELVSTEQLRIDFQLAQRFYPLVEDNATLTIRFDAHPQRSFTGTVINKVPLSSSDARTFLLRTQLEETDSPLLIPGMSADATLQLSDKRRGIVVNRDALRRYPDARVSVWILEDAAVGKDQPTVREQQVETGLSFAGLVEIRSGLAAGQRVVTRGNETLREGQTVQITTAESE
ncbi:efflux RND transporter periplasmic adaptor subunit [Halopseudomonas pelagia]|uniref:efflux RND transporter periplasmic adaptor subunit n=1 Tax=Halopseudomonas pelagia TaxID=553151 RepID=UPI00039C07FC|nr:efflux RND transporter periplasmic adaptor subunit [Halopseudomonas pelagia]|tara:strand:+ start:1310 stop:2434 length:1125 start_codon:yes stop_codon:yes gene_type:complete